MIGRETETENFLGMVRASMNWIHPVMASRAFSQSTLVSQYKMRPDHPEAFSHPVYTFPCTGGLLNSSAEEIVEQAPDA